MLPPLSDTGIYTRIKSPYGGYGSLNEDDLRALTRPIHLFPEKNKSEYQRWQRGFTDEVGEDRGGSHSIGSRFICRINVEKVFLMADNSGPIVISETYCRWTSYIIPEASTQPTKRIHSLFLSPPPPPISSTRFSLIFSHVTLSLSFSLRQLIGHERESFSCSPRTMIFTTLRSFDPRLFTYLSSPFVSPDSPTSCLFFLFPPLHQSIPRSFLVREDYHRSARSLALKLTLLWIDVIIVIEYLSPRGISFRPSVCVTMPRLKSRY